MSQSHEEGLLQSMQESFAAAVETRSREGFPRPRRLEEWRSWLTYEACLSVYRGVQTDDVVLFRNVLTLLAALRAVIALGVAYAPAFPSFPAFLFEREDVERGVFTSHTLRPGVGRAFQEVLDELDQKLAMGQQIQEFCELSGLPNPGNMAEWVAVLIHMGCIMITNTKSFLDENATFEERAVEARRRVDTDLHEIDDAACVFQGVERLVSYGVRPDPRVRLFPL